MDRKLHEWVLPETVTRTTSVKLDADAEEGEGCKWE
jgi:hypothetical protein